MNTDSKPARNGVKKEKKDATKLFFSESTNLTAADSAVAVDNCVNFSLKWSTVH
jgi:hypothetical protein